jgi:integrase
MAIGLRMGDMLKHRRRMASHVAAAHGGVRRAGGLRFTEHSIRATAGTVMEETHGAEAAQKLLGHADE